MEITTETKAVEPKPPSQGLDWMKYLSVVAALAIVAAATVALFSLNVARQAAQGAMEIFQPQTKYSTVLSGAITQLNNNPKLVVLTADINATVGVEGTTKFLGINISSAKVEITAPAKVQYYLKLKDIGMNDLYYDQLGKRLVVTIPRPIFDTEVIALDTDPDKLSVRTELGWSPLSIFKGGTVREDALRHLREAAISQGRHELLQDRADKNAKEIVGDMMSKVKDALKQDGVRLEVEFKKQ